MIRSSPRLGHGLVLSRLGRSLFSTPMSTTTTTEVKDVASKEQRDLVVLGIESSCDDSCVGIIRYPTGEILADERTSQFHVHSSYGGIVPILAVREHEVNLPKRLWIRFHRQLRLI